MKFRNIFLAATVMLLGVSATLFVYNPSQAQAPQCWFDQEHGCDPSGYVGCTGCNDDGPVITK
jgi:hypothetical protein